jgi:hypothetical protein
METFSLARAVPGMRPGAKSRNAALVALSPALVLVWPFVAAYAVGTDRGGCAGALDAVPGIARGGGGAGPAAAFGWTTLALTVAFAPLALAEPTLLRQWLTLAVPALYLLSVGFAVTQTVGFFRAWWALRQSADSGVTPGPVQLTGTAVPAEETVETPFSGTEALAHVSGRFEYTGAAAPGTINESAWELRERNAAAVPFELEHGGESVLVDATEAAVTLDAARSTVRGDDGPSAVESLPDGIPAETATAPTSRAGAGPSGFVEQRVEPGAEVTVSGVAVPAGKLDGVAATDGTVVTDAERAPPRLAGDSPTPFVVTDDANNAAGWDLLRRGLGSLVLALLLVVPLAVSPLPGRLAALLGL